MRAAPVSCLIISDGRRGIENQALGLAEALDEFIPLSHKTHRLSPGRIFAALPPSIQNLLKTSPSHYGINTPLPRLAIGCGRQAIAPLRALKRVGGVSIFTIYIQDPRVNPCGFDLVIAPSHDQLEGENIVSIIGAPGRVNRKRLRAELGEFTAQIRHLPSPRIAVLIGGQSKTHTLSITHHNSHLQEIAKLIKRGNGLMITTSRRTPGFARDDYRALAKIHKNVWLWDDGKSVFSADIDATNINNDNPYFAFLGAADAVLVTQDSTNMLTEACATGKPVFTLPMHARTAQNKFDQLYAELKTRCNLAPYSGILTAPIYDPLNETRRAAKIVAERLSKSMEKTEP